MINRNQDENDQPKKTCFSILMSVLSKLTPKNLFIFYLLASSHAFASAMPATTNNSENDQAPNTDSSVSTATTVYMRGTQPGNYLASATDTVNPAPNCILQVQPVGHNQFSVKQACDDSVQHRPVSEQIREDLYTSDRLSEGILERTISQKEEDRVVHSYLDFTKENAVTEKRYETKGSQTQSSTTVFLRNLGKDAGENTKYVTNRDEVVKPASGCTLVIAPIGSPNDGQFQVKQACDGSAPHRSTSHQTINDVYTGDVLNKGVIERSLTCKEENRTVKSELDFRQKTPTFIETRTETKGTESKTSTTTFMRDLDGVDYTHVASMSEHVKPTDGCKLVVSPHTEKVTSQTKFFVKQDCKVDHDLLSATTVRHEFTADDLDRGTIRRTIRGNNGEATDSQLTFTDGESVVVETLRRRNA